MDRHAEQREQKRRKRSKGGKQMIVQGRGYVRLNLQAIEKGAKQCSSR